MNTDRIEYEEKEFEKDIRCSITVPGFEIARDINGNTRILSENIDNQNPIIDGSVNINTEDYEKWLPGNVVLKYRQSISDMGGKFTFSQDQSIKDLSGNVQLVVPDPKYTKRINLASQNMYSGYGIGGVSIDIPNTIVQSGTKRPWGSYNNGLDLSRYNVNYDFKLIRRYNFYSGARNGRTISTVTVDQMLENIYTTKLFMSNSTRPVSHFHWAYQSLIPDFSTMTESQLEWKSLKQLQNEGLLTIIQTNYKNFADGTQYLDNIIVEIVDGYYSASALEQDPIFTFISMGDRQNNTYSSEMGESGFVQIYLEY